MHTLKVQEISAYQTSDARTFFSKEEADAHERRLQAGAKAGEYVAGLGIENKRHRTRLENIISQFVEWEMGGGKHDGD